MGFEVKKNVFMGVAVFALALLTIGAEAAYAQGFDFGSGRNFRSEEETWMSRWGSIIASR